ncbi:MAG: peptide-methionine (R)-S-oxide reductase [Planctomycetota bacterium]|nr:MAG: peptide-methionine (R)-S-oxide reductase [Planctomycetota bacterium]
MTSLPPSPFCDDEELRQRLGDEAYFVLRQQGTERPFSGRYYQHAEAGLYRCAACGQALFRSDAKFDAGCGWPSFMEPVSPDALTTHRDASHGMLRIEVRCGRCGSHHGHVFDDGPGPRGLRYCINSVCLDFEADPPA